MKWIKYSFRVWAAYLTAWLVIGLGLAMAVLLVLIMAGLIKVVTMS